MNNTQLITYLIGGLLGLTISAGVIVMIISIIKEIIKTIKKEEPTTVNNEEVNPEATPLTLPEIDENMILEPSSLNEIFVHCGYYRSHDKKEEVVLEDRDGQKHKIQRVHKEFMYPTASFYPSDGSPVEKIVIKFPSAEDRPIVSPPNNLKLFGELLFKAGVIDYPELDYQQGNASFIHICKVITEEVKRKVELRNMLDTAGLYNQDPITKDKKYVDLKQDEKTKNLILNTKGLHFTEDNVLKAIPHLSAFFKDTFDDKKFKSDNDIITIRKTVPVSNMLGLKKVEKEILNPETQEIERKTVIEPETIFDKEEEWREHLRTTLNAIKFEYTPMFYIGKNQYDDGELDELFIKAMEEAHILVGGAPGSGKTETIKSIILRYILDTGANVRFFDGKGAETWRLAADKLSQFPLGVENKDRANISPVHELYCLIQDLHKVMQARILELKKVSGAENYVLYNKILKEYKMKPEVLLIDEWGLIFGHLVSENSFKSPPVGSPNHMLLNILKMGRSVGCQIIIITQNIKDNEIPNDLKNLLPIKLIHKSDKTTGTYLGISHPIDALAKGTFIFKATEAERLLKNHFIGSDLKKMIDLMPHVPESQKKNYDYNELFIDKIDKTKMQSIARTFKKFLIKEGYEVVHYNDEPDSTLDDESIFIKAVKNNIEYCFGYLKFKKWENKFFKTAYKNHPNTKYFFYLMDKDDPKYSVYVNESAKNDPTSGIRNGTFVLGSTKWFDSILTIAKLSESTDVKEITSDPLTYFIEKIIKEEQGDGFQESDLDTNDNLSVETPQLNDFLLKFTKKAEPTPVEVSKEDDIDFESDSFDKTNTETSTDKNPDTSVKTEEKKTGRKTFSIDEKIKILKEQLDSGLSNVKIEEKYKLANGSLGKWKKELNGKY